MQLIVGRDSLSRGLARIQGVLNRKATMPVLSNALLEARTDGSCGWPPRISTSPSTAACPREVERPGRITVDGKRLYEIARNLPGEEVSITVDDDQRVTPALPQLGVRAQRPRRRPVPQRCPRPRAST
jgi:DNA polymerase-3 subunit beta